MELVTQYQDVLPLLVFIVILSDSLPFVGLFLPEELVLAVAVILSSGIDELILVFLASFSAMFIGQMAVYSLSNRYGDKVLVWFKVPAPFLDGVRKYIKSAGYRDHILIRLSSNSMFRITASFLTAISGVPFAVQVRYEAIAAFIKTSIFLLIGLILSPGIEESEIEGVLGRIGIAILIITFMSLSFSYYLRRKLIVSK